MKPTRGFVWLGHDLRQHPGLELLHRRDVFMSAASCTSIAFPVPLQMPAAMLAAVALRANVAAAAAPWLNFTMAPVGLPRFSALGALPWVEHTGPAAPAGPRRMPSSIRAATRTRRVWWSRSAAKQR